MLNDRLPELRNAGIIAATQDGGYQVTTHGRQLLQALQPVGTWAERVGRLS